MLQFFADEARILTLDHPVLQVGGALLYPCSEPTFHKTPCFLAIQEIIDACLFEPGLWQHEDRKLLPGTIPGPDRRHLATPSGRRQTAWPPTTAKAR